MRSTKSVDEVRTDLLDCREIALLDVREEAIHAEGHPLFAANLPLSRLELEVYSRIPLREAPIVVFDDGEALAQQAATRLLDLGYGDVKVLEGGLQRWRDAGYEVFRDVNAPSKAFGELVECLRHTPSVSAQQTQSLIDRHASILIVDARRFEEFQVMSIPTAISVPGAELVLAIEALAAKPETQIIVNCAGRTRSIIGAQSLINAGIPHSVAALRNGTIGWKLAGQTLEHGQWRTFPKVDARARQIAATAARKVAERAGVKRIDVAALARWIEQRNRTIYRFDVRTPQEYEKGHLPGFRNAPGGQLVQETDVFAPVRGAVIVIVDDRGGRADMTASWLKQMAWEVLVLTLDGCSVVDACKSEGEFAQFTERGRWAEPLPAFPELPDARLISTPRLKEFLAPGHLNQSPLDDSERPDTVILDLAPSVQYAQAHINGSWFALRSMLAEALCTARGKRYVLTSSDGAAARFAWAEANELAPGEVYVLDGGTTAWATQEELTSKFPRYASPPIDRYNRPYEGTDASQSSMQAYLDWEGGLVEQLVRDGTHGFRVL